MCTGLKKCSPTTRSGRHRRELDVGDAQARGVRRQDRILPRGGFDRTQDLDFEVEAFGDGLDDEVGVADGLREHGVRTHSPERGIERVRLDLPALDALFQIRADTVQALADPLVDRVAERDGVTSHCRDLRDSVAHCPRAEHGDALQLLGRRSRRLYRFLHYFPFRIPNRIPCRPPFRSLSRLSPRFVHLSAHRPLPP